MRDRTFEFIYLLSPGITNSHIFMTKSGFPASGSQISVVYLFTKAAFLWNLILRCGSLFLLFLFPHHNRCFITISPLLLLPSGVLIKFSLAQFFCSFGKGWIINIVKTCWLAALLSLMFPKLKLENIQLWGHPPNIPVLIRFNKQKTLAWIEQNSITNTTLNFHIITGYSICSQASA